MSASDRSIRVKRYSLNLRKITHYLLDLEHPIGASKAKFFRQNGFSAAKPTDLMEALVAQARGAGDRERTFVARSGGRHMTVDAALSAPDGTSPFVRSVWRIEDDGEEAIFVTCYPIRRRRPHGAR